MKIPKSKRLRFTIGILIVNYITVWIGMYSGSELISLGTCIVMVNTPMYMWLGVETYKPSKDEKPNIE